MPSSPAGNVPANGQTAHASPWRATDAQRDLDDLKLVRACVNATRRKDCANKRLRWSGAFPCLSLVLPSQPIPTEPTSVRSAPILVDRLEVSGRRFALRIDWRGDGILPSQRDPSTRVRP